MKERDARVKTQRGFTLVELVMAMGVGALIAAAAGTSIYQVINVNSRSTARMTAIKQVENAVDSISRDAEMAQFAENAAPVSSHSIGTSPDLTVTWDHSTFGGTMGSATYAQNGNTLQRTFTPSGGSATTNTVAQHIDFGSGATTWSFSNSIQTGPLLSFKVTATVNGISESRSFQIVPRSTR
jgi:prepilin-type N-terminal cleavage/methylation domain-containing protein